jgi:hypothetical protein
MVALHIWRQDRPTGDPQANGRWEDFRVPLRPGMNIISC